MPACSAAPHPPGWTEASLTLAHPRPRSPNPACLQNFTNPGAISHNEILQLYKDYVDPEFEWSNFTVEEQAKVGRRCSGSGLRLGYPRWGCSS